MQALNLHHPGRSLLLFLGSLLFALYVLAPVAWLMSSSFQPEAEITSRPPHWIPHQPTMERWCASLTNSTPWKGRSVRRDRPHR